MKKLLVMMAVLLLLSFPVSAAEYQAPEAPEEIQKYMPGETESFGEGLLKIIKAAVADAQPHIAEAAGSCLSVLAITVLTSILGAFGSSSEGVLRTAGVLSVGLLFIQPAHALIALGAETVLSLSEYGKLLLPVMTAALAAQGGTASSAALYVGTSVLCSLFAGFVARVLIPLLYVYLAVCITGRAFPQPLLHKLRDFLRWLLVWSLKILLYVFTGYLTVTGVISGTTDAAALKAAKLTISGVVPVVGGILSDASETVLVGAGVMKNAAGVYGMLAMTAIWIGPFLRIGVQYLMTKGTAALCSVFGSGGSSELAEDISGLMGILLAMTGTVCLLLLVSTVCFMKGIHL